MLNKTAEFDPDEIVQLRMGTVYSVLKAMHDIYDLPVVVGGIVLPGTGVTAGMRNKLSEAMLTLFRALPEVTETSDGR